MSAEQRNEPHRRNVRRMELAPAPHHQFEHLFVETADRHDHAAALGELLDERLRDRRPAGTDENRIVG